MTAAAECPQAIRLLVADDDEASLAVVSSLLRRAGYDVLVAHDGEEALAMVNEQLPDAVVLDVVMPKLDGLDVTTRLRADPSTHGIPVLLLTALGSDADVARGFASGGDDYLRKPFSSEELRVRVQALLQRRDVISRLVVRTRTDALTGLLNRRAWDEELPRALARSARHASTLCIAVLDLDRFKRFNDQHGHPAGDGLLRDVAAAWRIEARHVDLLARCGGEEFGLLLPTCGRVQARAVVERLRAAVPRGQTCSVGIAEWNGLESADRLSARADAALYAAKRGGRDRAMLAPAL